MALAPAGFHLALSVCCIWVPAWSQQDRDVLIRSAEKEMQAQPLQALAIARKAADALDRDSRAVRGLFESAAQIQRVKLAQLNAEQLVELASTYEKTLDDRRTARAVKQQWLRLQTDTLGEADGPGRVSLARHFHRWLEDREAAVKLCLEALRLSPGLPSAEELLQKDLGYRKVETGWLPAEVSRDEDLRKKVQELRAGMTSGEVRQLLGSPSSRSRQVVYRRSREQWRYKELPGFEIGFDCFKGQDPRVHVILLPVELRR